MQASLFSLSQAGFAGCSPGGRGGGGEGGGTFSTGSVKFLRELISYSDHLNSIKTATSSGLVVRHSGRGKSSQAV